MILRRQFGAQAVNPKPLVKVLGKLFAHADKNVRAEVRERKIGLCTGILNYDVYFD